MTTISDLSWDLVWEIFSRVPLTSLNAVRSTCKTWNALSKNQILGQKAVKKQFMAFMLIDYHYSVYTLRFELQGIRNESYNYEVDLGKQISMPTHQVEISHIFHCDGLMLCIPFDQSRLLVCNPYLWQSRVIQTRNKVHRRSDMYALGYDDKNNHKILSFSINKDNLKDIEVYDFSSDSWRVLDVRPVYCSYENMCFVSLRGNTYFCSPDIAARLERKDYLYLVCFDFTTERFGPLLPLPFQPYGTGYEDVTLTRFGSEKLVLLYNHYHIYGIIEIWITTKIEPNEVLWNKFLTLNMNSYKGLPHDYWFYFDGKSFFIEEEKKVVVLFDLMPRTYPFQMAYIIGEDGYFRSVNIGEARYPERLYCGTVRCYFYIPSLVQLKV